MRGYTDTTINVRLRPPPRLYGGQNSSQAFAFFMGLGGGEIFFFYYKE